MKDINFNVINNTTNQLWSLIDVLRNCIAHNQYGRVLTSLVLFHRFNSINDLSNTKNHAKSEFLGHLNKKQLEQRIAKDVVQNMLQGFENDVLEVLEIFKFDETIDTLLKNDVLSILLIKLDDIDLSKKSVANYEMGEVFANLIRRISERNQYYSGDHHTPSDIVQLVSSIIFEPDLAEVNKLDKVSLYDPTAGSGGFLSSGIDFIKGQNPELNVNAYGQEINQEVYATCKAFMLVKGQDSSNIKLGNTITDDCFKDKKFDYVLSAPPFGLSWKRIENIVEQEYKAEGYDGRFGPGLPRMSDGTSLFILHIISKFKPLNKGGSKAGVIVSGSFLSSGDANSGESEIRRYLIENDLIESIVKLPINIYMNTSIRTFLLILTNKKPPKRKFKIQLIDGSNHFKRMKKRLGSKSNSIDVDSIEILKSECLKFKNTDISQIVSSDYFAYRKVKLILPDKSVDFERVPINQSIEDYLHRYLKGLHDSYEIDFEYKDQLDNQVGKVGYIIDFDKSGDENIEDFQFRHYFDEVKSNDDWDFCLNQFGKPIFTNSPEAESYRDKSSILYFKISDLDNTYNPYLKHYFNSIDWKEWLFEFSDDASVSRISKFELLRKAIKFPELDDQVRITNILDRSDSILNEIKSIKDEIYKKTPYDLLLQKYNIPVSRNMFDQIIDVAPFPFANLLHHYRSVEESSYKERYEILLKYVESYLIFLCSVVLGCLLRFKDASDCVGLKKQSNKLKNASFGCWGHLFKKSLLELNQIDVSKKFSSFSDLFNQKLLDQIELIVKVRNSTTGHGSYPTKAAARKTFETVERINDSFMHNMYELCETYKLVRPKNCNWDGQKYMLDLEEFSGLGSYPFGLMSFESFEPLITNKLYVVSDKSSHSIELFPFIQMIDIDGDSDLEAFYFYSNYVGDQEKGSRLKYISHQQIYKQSQLHGNELIENIFK